MSTTVEISSIVHISAPAGHTLMAQNQSAQREKAGRYLAALLAGLGVPGASGIHWEKQAAGNNTLEMRINGQPARLRHSTANSTGARPADVVQALCEDMLRNRTHFAGSALADYAAGKADASFQRFQESDRLQVVQSLFAQGFGLQRVVAFVPAADAARTPEAWAEACMGDLEATRFVMHATAGQIDPDEDPHDFNRLVESAGYFVDVAFKIKGVPIPKLRTEKRADFAANEMAFQINDLIFPVFTIGDMTGENLRFVNFLTANGAFFLNRGSVDFLLDSLEAANPNLLALARSRFSTDFITTILRRLTAENISIRPLVRILEILVSGGQDVYRQHPGVSEAPPLSEIIHLVAGDKRPEQLDLTDWSELVRVNLKNAIINRALPHFEEGQTLSCFYLENTLFEKITRFDALSAEEQTAIRKTVHRQIAENHLTPAGKIRPFITAAAWRKKVSDLIAYEFPDTPVFSLQECLPRIVARFDKMIAG